MEKLTKKGFILVELIATIVVLALVVSISAYAITNIINSAKEKNYDRLIKNINAASETYYQECKYCNNTGITCNDTVTLQELVNYGYLKGNGTKDNKMEIINPKDNKNIGACSIAVKNENGKLTIEGSCPKEDN